MPEQPGACPVAPPGVQELARRRDEARRARDFALADELRDQIRSLGWAVTDSPHGFALAPSREEAPQAVSRDGVEYGYRVLPDPGAMLMTTRPPVASRVATVGLLVEGWPDDLRQCVAALLEHMPAGVVISGLDVGNTDGAGDVLEQLSVAHPGLVETWHVPAGVGWGAARNGLLRVDPAPVHMLMETSTILSGDALSPLLSALSEPGVVAAGWWGAVPDPDLRSFHDAGPGRVTALLGYLMAVRAEVAKRVGGLSPKARFYRNADLEFSLRLGREGALVVPPGQLPAWRARHRGYHESAVAYRDAESRRNYRRVLDLLRSREHNDLGG
jgi:hypothetical protein